MAKFAQGEFVPKNPEKYVGRGRIKYRSSWELAFMTFIDNHPGIIQWASESIQIPYKNPLTGKQTIYVPDFFIYYENEGTGKHGELIEIKPKKETTMENARSQRDKLMVIVNTAKWLAANVFCKNHGLTFRIITEEHLFHQGKK